jgi:hypothetical protein
LAQKISDVKDEAVLFGVLRKVTVEAMGQCFLLPEYRFSP